VEQLILLGRRIAERLVPVARQVVVADGAFKLTCREIDPLAADEIVEVSWDPPIVTPLN
jgi:hypothetical protein